MEQPTNNRSQKLSWYDAEEGRASHPLEACVELTLLLHSWQWTALEQAAARQGLTIGQLVRRLLTACLAPMDAARVTKDGSEPADAARSLIRIDEIMAGLTQ